MEKKIFFCGFAIFLVLLSVIGTVVAWKFVDSGFGIQKEVQIGAGVVGTQGGEIKFEIIPQNKSQNDSQNKSIVDELEETAIGNEENDN